MTRWKSIRAALRQTAAIAARHLASAIWRVLPLSLIALAFGATCTIVWREALAESRFRLAGDLLSLNAPKDCRPEAVREVERFGLMAAGRFTLEPDLLHDLRQQYQSSPWVRQVVALRRIFPNRLEIDVILRAPAAQVQAGGGRGEGYFWLVDEDGVLLPVPGARAPHAELPQIVGVQPEAIGRQPAEGQTWSDAAVLDSLALLKQWRNAGLAVGLAPRRILVHRGAFLDTSRRRISRPRFEIETADGLTILWGTYNRGDLPDEISTAEKFAQLQRLLQSDGSALPGIRLDVRTRVPGFSMVTDRR